MTMRISPQEPLNDAAASSGLFADWLVGQLVADFFAPEHQSGQNELLAALEAGPAGRPAPLFQSSWIDGWAEAHEKDLPTDDDRRRFRSQVSALRAGQADIVVTGQQPGFLGGPLYTLYKVATTIALARQRTLAGKPTVPVFWSGDDDDDVAEALQPVALEPGSTGLRKAPPVLPRNRASQRPVLLGRRTSDPITEAASTWLQQAVAGANTPAGCLAADLASLWAEGVSAGWNWARLARRSVLRVFQGTGLMVVSGDDPGLHDVAQPLYQQINQNFDTLKEKASFRGKQLASDRWHAQINPRSLKRPLFLVTGDRRTPWVPGSGPLPEASSLRPGVMLRSPVQDWLLRPVAVVVGPGELAYLRQLDSVYAELGLHRPSLVPRLFAWLVPGGMDLGQLVNFRKSPLSDPKVAADLATQAENQARRTLTTLLKENLQITGKRALKLAEGRARRWRKGIEAMVRDEIQRTRQGASPWEPEWVFPEGQRQERRLAYLCAAALWGEDLVTACLEAAGQHLELGKQGSWREFVIEVPNPD